MEKIRDGDSQKREDAGERKGRYQVGKSQNTVFFQCFVAPEGRKVGGDIWAGGQMRNENLNAVVA